jgi:uncharacterized protein (TIGR02058 family)
MDKKRFIIEMGIGIEQHGQEVTKAAIKALRDAMSRVCMVGLTEMISLSDPNDMIIDVLVACPRPQELDLEALKKAIPFGQKEISVVAGGMTVRGHYHPGMSDKSDEIIVANAAITVCIDMDKTRRE